MLADDTEIQHVYSNIVDITVQMIQVHINIKHYIHALFVSSSRRMALFGRGFAKFCTKDNAFDFRSAFLHIQHLLKKVYSNRKEFCFP